MIVIPSLGLPHPDSAPPGETTVRDRINEWEWQGYQRVQIVEPESRTNRPLNRRAAEDVLREARVDVQIAGDIRSADDVEALISSGACQVVLGGRALDDADWLVSTVGQFPGQLIVSTTARERRIRTRGAVRTLPIDLRDLADELSDLPIAALLVTFPSDAEIEHVDLALLEDLTEAMPYSVFVGGGMPTIQTLRDLEFRGVGATIIDSARLTETFDEQTLARGFAE